MVERWQVLRTVRLRALADSPGAFGATWQGEQRQPEAFWRARAEQGCWFLAHDGGGHPVGVVAAVAAPSGEPAERQLDAMWVEPRWRGRGVGEALAGAVLAWAAEQGADRVSLTVVDGNDAARGLYLRLGFRPTGEREPRPRDPGRWRERMRVGLAGPGSGLAGARGR
ncbi:GNAT family N-acetyltransferase [Kitasatospora viridis]